VLGALSLFSAPSVSAHALAGGNGNISGRLLDGTNKNAPLANQQVTLQMAQASTAQDLATARTNAQGMFSFAHLATDQTVSYALYINYQGAQYTSQTISLAKQANQQQNLTVYEATRDSSKVAVVNTTLLVRDPDIHHGTFTVSAVYDFKNLNTRTYVGSLDASKGKPNALLFPLPAGSKNIKLNSGFDGYNVIQVDKGFATNAALPPGDSQFAFSYDVPYSGVSYDFSYTPLYPTVSFSALVPPDMHVSAQSLQAHGLVTGQDQHQYQNFTATVLRPQQTVHMLLEGFANPASANASSPFKLSNLWLIVGVLILIAILFATAAISHILPGKNRKRGRARGKGGYDKGSAKPAKHARSEQDELLHDLLELDKAYEAGDIAKATYNERRARTKARLRALMREREVMRR
jgi:5-hydroxyisourate hydrolase-like protein (transthyretin family)